MLRPVLTAVVACAVLVPTTPSALVAAAATVARCSGTTATVVGTSGDDDLVGTPGADVFAAYGGDDTIVGGGGSDVVCAGRGHDTVLGGGGRDYLVGARGADVLRGGPGDDRLNPEAGGGGVYAGPGNDIVEGRSGALREARGGAGDDIVLVAFADGQRFRVAAGGGVDLVTLVRSAPTPGTPAELRLQGGRVLADARRTGTVRGAERFHVDGGRLWRVLGTDSRDDVFGGVTPLRVRTFAGRDRVAGSVGSDVIDTGAGHDHVDGMGGADTCRHWETGRC